MKFRYGEEKKKLNRLKNSIIELHLYINPPLLCRNTCVTMGAALSAPEYRVKVADVSKVRTLNAIARNTL